MHDVDTEMEGTPAGTRLCSTRISRSSLLRLREATRCFIGHGFMQLVADELPKKRTIESATPKAPCPRSVRAWQAWLGALGNDAEAAQAAALAYEQLDASGREAWIDSLAQDAKELAVPRIAVYAPLLAVELDKSRRQRIQSALGPMESGAAPRQTTRALVGTCHDDLKVAVLISPLYMDFVQVMACGYRVGDAFDWVRHDPIVSTHSTVRAGDAVGGVVVEACPLKGVIDELALTIVAHNRARRPLPPTLRAFAHVFGPAFGS